MHVAPLKKQRHLTSTPHPQSPVDIPKERDATKLRLIGVWSSLADRYTRPLDEDDMVNIITGKITTDRGVMRNSRKISFGAIAAPSAEDVTADEGTDEDEDEYDTDELDAFADTISKADNAEQSEKELRVPPVTGLGLADADDLRAFLEAERRRKDLCGNEVEEDDYSTDSGPAGTEDLHSFLEAEHNLRTGKDLHAGEVEDLEDDGRTALDSASEDELNNWHPDESNIVYPVLKQGDDDNDSDIEIIEGPILSPSKSTAMQKLANKSQDQLQTPRSLNNSSTPTSNVRMPSSKPYILLTPRKFTSPAKSKTKRRDFTSKSSISGSGSESGASYRSPNPHSPNPHSPNPHSPNPHSPNPRSPNPRSSNPRSPNPRSPNPRSPRRKQQRHPLPPETFMPPLPDPRAQIIITQAMQQLSALVDTPWTPPHDSFIPHTPSRRQQSRCNPMFNTPTYHPHPYPYFYNPNLSLATLPPESPESVSSPEKSSHRPRKSSMARSYSREKRVSFKIDDGSGDDDRRDSKNRVNLYSSPRRVEAFREQRRSNFAPSKDKGKARAEAPDSDSSSEDNGKSHSRGRTPGLKFGPPKGIKRREDNMYSKPKIELDDERATQVSSRKI